MTYYMLSQMDDYMTKIKSIHNSKIIPQSRLCMSKNSKTGLKWTNSKKLELLNTKGEIF